MKKLLAIIISLSVLIPAITLAAYPNNFSNWASGNVITSAWLNSIESLLGVSPAKGSILAATSTTQAGWFSVGADGLCLTASSSAVSGLTWTTCGIGSFTTTTITAATTTLSSTAYTFATSSDTNLGLTIGAGGSTLTFTPVWNGTLADSRIASAGVWNAKITTSSLSVAYPPLTYNNVTGVFSLPTSTAGQSGFLSNTDWTIFNGKQAPYWSKTGTNVYLSTSTDFVGIGTSTPDHTLHIVTNTNNAVGIDSTGTDSNSMIHIKNLTAQGPFFDFWSVMQRFGLGLSSLGNFTLRSSATSTDPVNGTTLITIKPTGEVGLGTTTPATALVVNGAITQTSLGTGLVKSTSGVLGNATSGTDYQSPLTGSILGTAGQVTATANTNSIGTTTTLALATTTVTAGSYTNTNVTVDAYGRLTSASNGTGGSSATSSWLNNSTTGVTYLATSTDLVGIGTSTPAYKLVVASSTSYFAINPTSTIASIFQIKGTHIVATSTAPTITSCGTSPSITGSDMAGLLTVGTGVVTSCTLNFATLWTRPPACIVNSNTAIASQTVTMTTSTMVVGGTAINGDILSYICLGNE